MPSRKGESALGKGLDALIKEKPKLDGGTAKAQTKEKPTRKAPSKQSQKTKKTASKPKEDPYKVILDNVVLEVRKNPRISLWSARSAAVLRFLKNTKPAFSISKEASSLIEEAVQQKYPEIWEMFEEEDF
ncbi:MAG: AAA family ATPase [Methanobacteriaceae archaeon]|nr:AAA family ATPase [Methanobacteriaceae archaeon]